MRVEIACASRELFGADRSAARLGALLAELGHDVSLALPRQRPELGLAAHAGELGIASTPAGVAVASSRGVSGLGGLLRRTAGHGAELEIYNSAAVLARSGDRRPRVLCLREWLDPTSRRHRALCALHARRTDAVVAVSSGVAERWRACAGDRDPGRRCARTGSTANGWSRCRSTNARASSSPAASTPGRARWRSPTRSSAHSPTTDPRPPADLPRRRGIQEPVSPRHAVALRERCRRAGWTLLELTPDPREEIARAALVVVPSLRPEPFGNVILEGLASGARVIAFPGGGVDDLAPLFPGSVEVVDARHRRAGRGARALVGGGRPGAGA